jgi:protoporphyrinogen oxidase
MMAVTGKNTQGEECRYAGDYFFSTTSVQELVRFLKTDVPTKVREVSEGLQYRDFVTVGLLLNRLKIQNANKNGNGIIADNWIYLQDPDVLAGRLQIFNNWSPYLVADPSKVWVGVEYFCREGGDLWRRSDREMADLAIAELDKIKIIDKSEVVDFTVARMPKTYPAYFGAYERFGELREYLDRFENLFLVGRNGMHKYNNQDHSMLTAMVSVDNIIEGRTDKSNIWDVNTEMEYHEAKKTVAKHLRVTPAVRPEIGRMEGS